MSSELIRMNENVSVKPGETKEIEAILGGRKVRAVFKNTHNVTYNFVKLDYEHKFIFDEVYTISQNGGKLIV